MAENNNSIKQGHGPWLIAGLGNPDNQYEHTRHNIGFMVADRISQKLGILVDRDKFRLLYGKGKTGLHIIFIAKPMAYMNLSGPPLQKLSAYFNIEPECMLVIHDDIDIESGKIKIKAKGGHGGHNGVRSIIEAFGCGDFPRIRIGIGRPDGEKSVTGHVLGTIRGDEKLIYSQAIETAADAAAAIIDSGIAHAMNRFN